MLLIPTNSFLIVDTSQFLVIGSFPLAKLNLYCTRVEENMMADDTVYKMLERWNRMKTFDDQESAYLYPIDDRL